MRAIEFRTECVRDALKRVEHAQATPSYGWPILCGVNVTVTATGLRFAAADNYRIAIMDVAPINAKDMRALKGFAAVTIATADVTRIIKALSEKNVATTITIAQVAMQTRIVMGSVKLECEPIPGNYPNYLQIMPSDTAAWPSVYVQPAYLEETCKALKDRSRDAYERNRLGITLLASPDRVTPMVVKGSDGYVEAIMQVRPQGEPYSGTPRTATLGQRIADILKWSTDNDASKLDAIRRELKAAELLP